MLSAFLEAVLPVFAVVAAGYVFGRTGLFSFEAASAINRFVFYFALPVLLFRLIATAPFEKFDWSLSFGFLLAELATYLVAYLIAHHVFGRTRGESILLGMCTAFANQVFFVLPIARQLYGDAGALPVVAVSTFDVLFLLGGTIFILELIDGKQNGGSALRFLRKFVRVPPVLAIAAGVIANWVGLPVTGGLEFFTRFVGETAAPCSLFGLGLILIAKQDKSGPAVPAAMIALKLIFMPFVAWIFLYLAFRVSAEWANPAMLVAAGPAGAMPYVLALQYQVPVASIARIIMISTIISLITVTLMTQIG